MARTENPVPHWLIGIAGAQELPGHQACQRPWEDPEVSAPYGVNLIASWSNSPSPPGRGDPMDTETVEQGCKATSFPFLPSPPPFCRMHSYNSRYKRSNDDHIWDLFFFWKKKKIQQPLLKLSIKIHICIIIHFKAIREEWEEARPWQHLSSLCLPEWSWRNLEGGTGFLFGAFWGITEMALSIHLFL